MQKKLKKNRDSGFFGELILSEPQGFVQKMHVDSDYKWTGGNPTEIFDLQGELGKGWE
jgi:hypothetical protein